jgi:hypothetical protein
VFYLGGLSRLLILLCRVRRRPGPASLSRLLSLGFSGRRLARSACCRGQSKPKHCRNHPSLK